MKNVLFIILAMSYFPFVSAQDMHINLADSKINNNHPYIETFKKKSEDYIVWLYYECKQASNKTSKGFQNRSLRNGHQSLVFEITENGMITRDTLRNIVHPNKAVLTGTNNLISGKLPEGVWISLDTNSKGKSDIKLYNKITDAQVELLVCNEKGEQVETLFKGSLTKGEFSYRWELPSRTVKHYYLYTSVNGELLIQRIVRSKNLFERIFG